MAAVLNSSSDFVLLPTGATFSRYLDQESLSISDIAMPSGQGITDNFFQPQSAYDLLDYGLHSNECPPPSMSPRYEIGKTSTLNDGVIRPTSVTSPPSFSPSYDHGSSILSSTSGSAASAQGSSADESPNVSFLQQLSDPGKWDETFYNLPPVNGSLHTEAKINDGFNAIAGMDGNLILGQQKYPGFVDHSFMQQVASQRLHQNTNLRPPRASQKSHHLPFQRPDSTSPIGSESSDGGSLHKPANLIFQQSSSFPLNTDQNIFNPQGENRRFSVASNHSMNSVGSLSIGSLDEDDHERSRCRDCGRLFKDLKAHMLTHQSERPEKCPIATCSYHTKGFARKYDKNRHTLTHYKGTMVCGFCPGSGSATEKSFNRADVFKRHLTSLHGVEQTPPNSRRKTLNSASTRRTSSDINEISGKCSTCTATFENAQDFYEHLDDCVLRVVQQEEPSEAINERILRAVNEDENVQYTLDRHMLPRDIEMSQEESGTSEGDDFEAEEEEPYDFVADIEGSKEGSKTHRSGKGAIVTKQREPGPHATHAAGSRGISKHMRDPSGKARGLTASRGGVPLIGKGRRRRKHYPASWGCSAEQMKMKKRVLCVYDGTRRLWKDDMMLDNEFEVRMRINNGQSYVTDLDVETVKRAEAFHAATDEEKGPWVAEDCRGDDVDLERLMA